VFLGRRRSTHSLPHPGKSLTLFVRLFLHIPSYLLVLSLSAIINLPHPSTTKLNAIKTIDRNILGAMPFDELGELATTDFSDAEPAVVGNSDSVVGSVEGTRDGRGAAVNTAGDAVDA
jgi:hypothetical protein